VTLPLAADARPILAPHCRVITVPPDAIVIVTDVDDVRLTGALFSDLSRYLDGLHTVPEITALMVASGTATAEEETSLVDHPYLLPTGGETTPDAHDHDWTLDGRANVERAIELVEGAGMNMHVLNCTRPDVGLPVAKVMVPGMRHFWPRFAPGRLYDVPVTLGWLDRPPSEADLNPLPIFW